MDRGLDSLLSIYYPKQKGNQKRHSSPGGVPFLVAIYMKVDVTKSSNQTYGIFSIKDRNIVLYNFIRFVFPTHFLFSCSSTFFHKFFLSSKFVSILQPIFTTPYVQSMKSANNDTNIFLDSGRERICQNQEQRPGRRI